MYAFVILGDYMHVRMPYSLVCLMLLNLKWFGFLNRIHVVVAASCVYLSLSAQWKVVMVPLKLD